MKFQVRIIVVTLAILVATLLLNSILSLASFEKIYVSSLVSSYELTAKNLKRKIESSLRYGKPLAQYEGMDKLLSEVMRNTPDLSQVAVLSEQGKLLYQTEDAPHAPYLQRPPPTMTDRAAVVTSMDSGEYITYVPLFDRYDKLSGYITLSFSRDVVTLRLKSMAVENLNTLWILMIFTSLGLIFVMTSLISRPIKHEIEEIGNALEWPPLLNRPMDRRPPVIKPDHQDAFPWPSDAEEIDTSHLHALSAKIFLEVDKNENELARLSWYIYHFVKNAYFLLEKLREQRWEQKKLQEACVDLDKFEQHLLLILVKAQEQLSSSDREQLEGLINVNRRLRKTLRNFLQNPHLVSAWNEITRNEPVSS